MSNLISTIRGFCNAGTADYVIGSTSYFTDDQIQAVLDRYCTPIRQERLFSHPVGFGQVSYYEYSSRMGNYEETTGGTARFIIQDANGTTAGTADWSANYETGRITFNADQAGKIYYLTGFSYDVYAAAADIWGQKGAYYATQMDWSTDGHNVKKSHISKQCEVMEQKYRAMSSFGGSSSGEIVRGDLC